MSNITINDYDTLIKFEKLINDGEGVRLEDFKKGYYDRDNYANTAQALLDLNDKKTLNVLLKIAQTPYSFIGRLTRDSIVAYLKKINNSVTDEYNVRPQYNDTLDKLKKCVELNIDFPGRFDWPILKSIIRFKQEKERPGRRLALLIYAKADQTKALHFNSWLMKLRYGANCDLDYQEVETGEEAVAKMLDATKDRQADVIIIAGHAKSDTLALGAPDPAIYKITDKKYYLNLTDIDLFRRMSPALKKGGQVIIIGCSAGEGGAGAPNLINNFRKYAFAQAREKGIFGMTAPGTINDLDIVDGIINNVIFTVPTYRAYLRIKAEIAYQEYIMQRQMELAL